MLYCLTTGFWFSVGLVVMIRTITVKTYAWASARAVHEGRLTREELEKKVQEVLDLQSEQGRWLHLNIFVTFFGMRIFYAP